MCAHLIVTLRAVLLAAALGLGWMAAPAVAAPPDNNADVYRAVREGTAQSITFTAPADRMLIQSEGQTWRQWRNGPITQIGGWMLAGVFVALVLFRLVRGKIMLEGPPTGRLIQRFSTVERMTHWTVALSFVLLAITGLTLLFGKHVVIPLIGYSAFSWIAALGKNVHNFVGPLFFASTLVMVALFARDNVWQAIDALWIRKAGGLLSGEHVPSWRFNFGEKTWFWIGVVILGLLVGITGLVLDFPGNGQIRQDMQLAHIIHTSGALIFIALSLGHIYIGSVGMEGSLESMKTGYVDETWAREHHEYWYREAKGGSGAAPVAPGSARPSTAH
ncbi:formate dehydrogenase subunit gamma [Zoogloeaceae bacterium G21618-S1]|nr:formate dehydrogenase subunit gamma [Zoogloeaceae bacterium G21618-S1]